MADWAGYQRRNLSGRHLNDAAFLRGPYLPELVSVFRLNQIAIMSEELILSSVTELQRRRRSVLILCKMH